MKMLKEFIIPFSSLKFGSNFHEFEIDKTFFEAFNYTRYEFCNIILQIDFRKENTLMDLQFNYSGYLRILCDRCLDNVTIESSGKFSNILKFRHGVDEIINDDVIYLSYESYEFNIAQLFYEYIVLNTPKKVKHNKGLCNIQQLELINKYSPSNKEGIYDLRWSKLKDLKNN